MGKDDAEEFSKQALAAFGWLSEFSFELAGRDHALSRDKSRPVYPPVFWSSSHLQLFIEVTLEYPRPALVVEFGPLVDGDVPAVQDISNRHHLTALVALKTGDEELAAEAGMVKGVSGRQLDRALRRSADLLREYGIDILRGDRSDFKKLEDFASERQEGLRHRYLLDAPGMHP